MISSHRLRRIRQAITVLRCVPPGIRRELKNTVGSLLTRELTAVRRRSPPGDDDSLLPLLPDLIDDESFFDRFFDDYLVLELYDHTDSIHIPDHHD